MSRRCDRSRVGPKANIMQAGYEVDDIRDYECGRRKLRWERAS